MNMLFRNLLFYLVLIPVTTLITATGFLFFFLPHPYRYWIVTRFSYFFIFWAKITCGLSYRVEGLENLPANPAIVLSNHQSAYETILFQVILPRQTWVLKKQLLFIPIFGWALWLIEPIAIDRKQTNSIKELIRQGKDKLKKGRWIVIFPEGTRVPMGENKRFTRTGAALAEKTESIVVPIAHNAGKFWPRGFLIQKPGTVKVVIGPTIESHGKDANEINKLAEDWIKAKMLELR